MKQAKKPPNPFDSFTNLYSLSKTLRFELKPVGKTLENMQKNLRWDKDLQTFLADHEIEDAYQKLKPIFDKLHEEFINDSLISKRAKSIDFSAYLTKYREKQDVQNIETKLHGEIGETFIEAGEKWKKEKYPSYEWKKGNKVANGSDILSTQDMLELIKDLHSDNQEIKKMIEETFKRFFTYFSGFNQNRENYYETKDEKATAIATRIVNENLPKFCDNLTQLEYTAKRRKDGTEEITERKSEYLNAYKYLKNQEKTTQIKDAETGKAIDAYPITEDVFQITHFSTCLSQEGIEKYNRIIGHYNLLINLYNQAKRQKEKDLDKKDRIFKNLPQFKTLWKQIGCGKKDPLFFELTHDTKAQARENKEKYNRPCSVEQILEQANVAGKTYFRNKNDDEVINTVPELLDYIITKDTYEGVYWSKAAINTISNRYFANWHFIKDRLKDKEELASFDKKREEQIKINDAVELEPFFAVLNTTDNWKEEGIFFKKNLIEKVKDEKENNRNQIRKEIIEKAQNASQALLQLIFSDIEKHVEQFFDKAKTALQLTDYKSEKSKDDIKTWMDHALAINQMLKYFLVKENKVKGNPIDSNITNALKFLLFESEIKLDGKNIPVEWFTWYDALRNYLTKKPQDDAKKNKLKLNFENSTLAGGWDVNKEPDNYCTIFQDQEAKQYLAIIVKQEKQKGYNKIFEKSPANPLYKIDNGEVWQKMEYKQIAAPTGIGGFVRKCFHTVQQYGWKCPDNCLNNEGKIIVKNDEAKANLKTIIDCYKDFFNKYEKNGFKYKDFSFNFKGSGEYEELNDFFGDVEKQGYKLSFARINKIILYQWVDEGKIYLFEIKNQDANDGKQEGHKNNLHTMYWKVLFENIENRPKLNGGAELFYRKALLQEKQEKIQDKHGKEVIKNFRFSKEKFLFHCPIKLNYRAKSYSKPQYALSEINDEINKRFVNNDSIYFLGIDRGEKHLAYYSLVNKNGNLEKQGTLDLPFTDKDGKPRSIKKQKYIYNKQKDTWESKEVECWDYNDLLDAMASNRDMARKNWKTIGTIKELKEGYISQVVRKIVDIATNENKPVFIVLEDLNTGFKRGRQKIEKSVYQKLELALAKKLNFLVDKSAKNGELGSVTKALQLTPPVNNYGDIENRKQVGIMLYTRANYTSQTDPVAGWRRTIRLEKGSEKNIKEQTLNEFTDIGFDGKDYYLTYTAKDINKQWTLYSGKNGVPLDRFRGKRGDKNEWVNEPINVVDILAGIFKNFDKNRSFHSQIADEKVELTKIDEKNTAWESLRFAIDVIQQIRNTGKTELDGDFIQSPVRDEHSNHFDSRLAANQEPNSGDANGAYNIARKGIIMSAHIQVWVKKGKPKYGKSASDLNLFVSEAEWDLYLANQEEWKEQLDIFSSRKAMEEWLAKNS